MATSRADGDNQPVRAIGRYELVSEIAPGALGELWKARIASGPEQGRIVAIRRVPRPSAFDKTSVERLTNVGFAAMEVRHPKVGAVLDVVVADSEIALVSEHIGGALLTALLRPPNGKRPNVAPDVALRIGLDVLEALDAVRVQWRDVFSSEESDEDRLLRAAAHGGLLPDSVLIANFGEAMLLDSGLAGIAMTVPAIVDHADVIAYRAPEQLEPGNLADERSDVFTVGVLLWELLAARPLFAPAMMPRPPTTGPAVRTKAFSDAMQVSTVKRKVLTAAIQRLDSLPLLKGRVTKEFADVVARCLERDPSKRFQSVRELVSAIEGLGPRAAAGHDAVSRLLSSVGATAPSDETPVAPGSGRSTSNRPTVPPENRQERESSPPDTRRAHVEGGTKSSTSAGGIDAPLSVEDIRSIPPEAAVESIPSATDVESLPPSADSRATSPAVSSVDFSSADVESLPPSLLPAKNSVAATDPVPFASALVPPIVAPPARTEEPTSAPVVSPVGGEGGVDLTSTLMSSQSARANRKVVLGVAAAVGLLVVIGIVRLVTSGGDATPPDRASASAAASVAPPSPPVIEQPPAPPATAEPVASERAPEPAAAEAAPSPTSAPAPAPVGATQPLPLKRQQPAKKKPFRPSGI